MKTLNKQLFFSFITVFFLSGCSQNQKTSPSAEDKKAEVTLSTPAQSKTEPNMCIDKNQKKDKKQVKKTTSAKSEKKAVAKKKDLKPVASSVIKKAEKKIPAYETSFKKNSLKVNKYCEKVDRYFKKYGWGKSRCKDYSWNHVRNSHWGDPLIWFVYGEEEKNTIHSKNVTLILCGVHGDEITPVKFCFDLLNDIKKNPELVKEDSLIAIAPIVTPDSFFKRRPTRTNARGVDINRNFPTKDWKSSALRLWKTRFRKAKRRYPGKKPLSEQETIFQVNLIKRYQPKKIISVHAPLTLLDYDGPTFGHKHGEGAKALLEGMSRLANKYKISNYPFFPGSLGNYAGNERKIPTFTLELPNSDWNKTREYYALFRDAIHLAIVKNLQK